MKDCCEVDRLLCIRLHFRSDVTSNPAARFSLSCHSFQLDFCHCHCHLTCWSAESCARGSLMRLGILLLRTSIQPEPSDLPPHTYVTSPRAPAVANWHLGDLATSHPLSSSLRERKRVLCFHGQSEPNHFSLASQRFSTRGACTLFGARSWVHATIHATSRVF